MVWLCAYTLENCLYYTYVFLFSFFIFIWIEPHLMGIEHQKASISSVWLIDSTCTLRTSSEHTTRCSARSLQTFYTRKIYSVTLCPIQFLHHSSPRNACYYFKSFTIRFECTPFKHVYTVDMFYVVLLLSIWWYMHVRSSIHLKVTFLHYIHQCVRSFVLSIEKFVSKYKCVNYTFKLVSPLMKHMGLEKSLMRFSFYAQ